MKKRVHAAGNRALAGEKKNVLGNWASASASAAALAGEPLSQPAASSHPSEVCFDEMLRGRRGGRVTPGRTTAAKRELRFPPRECGSRGREEEVRGGSFTLRRRRQRRLSLCLSLSPCRSQVSQLLFPASRQESGAINSAWLNVEAVITLLFRLLAHSATFALQMHAVASGV